MAFLEISYSELLVELSEEQQETVAGGESKSYVTEHRYTNEVSFADHSKEENGVNNGTEEPDDPFNSDDLMPLLPVRSLGSPLRFRLR
jgi:hypothetical protein